MNNKINVKRNTKFMVIAAMLAAISTILSFIEVPFIVPHLKLDFSEVPTLIGGIMLSPLYALAICLVKNALHLFVTSTFGIGELMNFIVGISISLPIALIFNKFRKTMSMKKSIWVSALITLPIAVITGLLANVIFYPVFINLMGGKIESSAVFITYLLSTIPMNIVKYVLTTVLVCPMIPILKKYKFAS
ncbi:MAG: ECF transporter S component [Oscillospiraceae bacterium]